MIESFFKDNVTEAELKEGFQRLARETFQGISDGGFTPLQNIVMDQCMMETFYSEFRRKILAAAVKEKFVAD